MTNSKQRFGYRIGLPVGLAFLLGQGIALGADTFPLESIDFVSTTNATEILLHTGSIVPYRTVLVSENKLVLDIDRVNAQQTIQTNFAGAQNVSHVVLQPLSAKTIRLIIRGEHLGQPEVGFKEVESALTHTDTPASSEFERPTNARIITPGSNALDEATLATETHHAFEALEKQNTQTAALHVKEEALEEAGIQAAIHTPSGFSKSSSSFEQESRSDLGSLTKKSALQHATPPEPTDFFGWLNPGEMGWILNALGVGGILLAFGFFIHRKVSNLSLPKGKAKEDVAGGKRPRFQELANAYQENQAKLKVPASTKQAAKKGFNTEPPIGLRSLKNIMDENDAPPTTWVGARAGQEAPPLPQRPIPTPPPQRQAVSQYQKQAQAVPAAAKRPTIDDNVLKQEIRNSVHAKQQMETILPPLPKKQAGTVTKPAPRTPLPAPQAARTPAAKGSGQLPPSNPEVLNFLRSVAEMMEKDGKTTVARKIQRQISQS